MKEQLESLVGMMVERGILLEEALTEFEKKFIRCARRNRKETSPAPRSLSESTATPSAGKWTNISWITSVAATADLVIVPKIAPTEKKRKRFDIRC